MRIEHVALWTRDLERLRSFHETYFEAQAGPRYVNPGSQFESYFLTFPSGGARIELMCSPAVCQSQIDPTVQFAGYTHLALSVGSRERVDALTARLAEDGFQVIDGPRHTGDGYYESSILDPDGNRIEITV